jgi:hypothetical protein
MQPGSSVRAWICCFRAILAGTEGPLGCGASDVTRSLVSTDVSPELVQTCSPGGTRDLEGLGDASSGPCVARLSFNEA